MPATTPWGYLIANGLLFNASWLVIVMSQSAPVAIAQVSLHLLVHFHLIGRGLRELNLIVLVALGGFLLDQALFRLGVFTLAGYSAPAPLWLSCLWPVFATTLCHAFAGLKGRLLIASVLGAVSGALSYIAGVRLSSVEFGAGVGSVLFIGALWAALFPALLQLAGYLVPADED